MDKEERVKIITGIFAECCRYPNVYIEPVEYDFGVVFQIRYLNKGMTYPLTNTELYVGKSVCKYSDYYSIGNHIREKLNIPPDLTVGVL